MEFVSQLRLRRLQPALSRSRSQAHLLRRVRDAYSSRTSRLLWSTVPMRKASSFSRSHIIRVGQSTGNHAFKTANKLLHATRETRAHEQWRWATSITSE